MNPQRRRPLAIALGAVWSLAFVLTWVSLDRDIVIVPFYVAPAGDPSGYPEVTHLPAWTLAAAQPEPALRPGDAVVRIAGASMRGAGRLRVVSHAWAAMGPDGRLAVDVEREGRAFVAHVAIPATIPKWPILIVSAVFGGSALLMVLRFGHVPFSAHAFLPTMALALWLAGNFGRTPTELLAAFWLRALALAALLPTSAIFFRHFPDGSDGDVRWARGWPWLLAIQGVFFLDAEMFGSLPPMLTDLGPKLLTTVAIALFLALGTIRFRRASPRGRRQFKWLLVGAYVGMLPPTLVATLSAVRPEIGAWFLPSQLSLLALPASLFIGIHRPDGFDVDRLWNATFVYLGAATLGVIGLVAYVPALSDWFVAHAEVGSETARVLGIALLLATAAPLAAFARHRLDAWVLAERREREMAVATLQRGIASAEKLEEVATRLVEGLPPLLAARGAALYADTGEGFGVVAMESEAGLLPPPAPPAGGALVRALSLAEGPLFVAELEAPGQGWCREEETLLGFAEAFVPLRVATGGGASGRLAGFVAIGPRIDAQEHDPALRPSLAAVAASAGATLTALEHGSLLGQARRLNRDLVERSAETERVSREKTSLLAAASHDLRQPLHALGLFLGALEERIADDDTRALLDSARASARSMEQMFESLLDVSQVDAGVLEPRISDDLALGPLLADVARDLAPEAARRGLRFRVRDTPLRVRSDAALLRSILQNLAGNALRYTESGGVLIGARRRKDRVRIEVWDTGPGFAPELRARLFSEWQRGTTRSRGADGGLGLGLTIVKRLTDLLGHELELASTPGRGSVFSLTLEAGVKRARTSARSPVAEARSLAGHRVLVVDDDVAARAALVAALEAWGLEVSQAADVESARAQAGSEAFDALLVDLELGGASGVELLASFPGSPACIVSGASHEALSDARARGLLVLRKPLEPVRLRAALEHLLASPRP